MFYSVQCCAVSLHHGLCDGHVDKIFCIILTLCEQFKLQNNNNIVIVEDGMSNYYSDMKCRTIITYVTELAGDY